MSINWHKKKQISNTTAYETKQAERGSHLSLACNSKLKRQRLHKCYKGKCCLPSQDHPTDEQHFVHLGQSQLTACRVHQRLHWKMWWNHLLLPAHGCHSCHSHAFPNVPILLHDFLSTWAKFLILTPCPSLSNRGIFWESLDFLGHHLQAPRNMSICRKSLPKEQKENTKETNIWTTAR